MCRSVVEGGRRCPCSGGAHRRAYQRAQYALQRANAVGAAAPTPAPPVVAVTDAAEPTVAAPVWRDPEPTRREAEAALLVLRGVTSESPRYRLPEEVQRYHAAVLSHGAVLRDNVLAAAQDAWTEAGVADDQIAALLDADAAETAAQLSRYRAEIADPTTGAVARQVAQMCLTALAERTPLSERTRIALEEANARRLELLAAAVRETVAAERPLGGPPRLAEQAPALRKADAAAFTAAVGEFPTELVEWANGRELPLLPKPSKKRAHYRDRATPEIMAPFVEIIHSGRPTDFSRGFALRNGAEEDAVAAHIGHSDRREYLTCADTPENRAHLQAALDRHLAFDRGLDTTADRAEIMEVDLENPDGTTEKRLYLGITTRRKTRRGPEVSELTFADHRSAVHEFAHHLEAGNEEVALACKAFLQRRTHGLEDEQYLPATRRRREERVTADSFVDCYMGRDYPHTSHTEIFSTGCEAIFAGSFGGLLGVEIEESTAGIVSGARRHRSDPEHFALVMGLLATANKAVS